MNQFCLAGERGSKNDPATTDTHPLVYNHADDYMSARTTEWSTQFNQRGFGAGGLLPLLFSHSSRNWGHHQISKSKSSSAKSHSKILPGVSLTELPYMDMENEVEEGESAPPSKRKKLMSKSSYHVVTVPSNQVKKYEGGRGKKRVQMKKGKYRITLPFY